MKCLNPVIMINRPFLYSFDGRIEFANIDNNIISHPSPYDVEFAANVALCSLPKNEEGNVARFDYSVHPFEIAVSGYVDGVFYPASNPCMKVFLLQVPCRKCELCCENRKQTYVHRIMFEAESSRQVDFVTLTFDRDHYPSRGATKQELQRFIDSFRKFIKRYSEERPRTPKVFDGDKFRYIFVSEYGHKGRGHYHGEMFNLPPYEEFKELYILQHGTTLKYITDPQNSRTVFYEDLNPAPFYKLKRKGCPVLEPSVHRDYLYLDYYVRKIWNNGLTCSEPTKDSAGSYCAKYINKPSEMVPEGCDKCFVLASNKNGGIGSQYCKTVIREFLKKNPTALVYKFRPRHSSLIYNIPIIGYVKNLALPRPSDVLSQRYVDSFKIYHWYNRMIGDVLEYQFAEAFFAPRGCIKPFRSTDYRRKNPTEYEKFIKKNRSKEEISKIEDYLYIERQNIDWNEIFKLAHLRVINNKAFRDSEIPYIDDLSDELREVRSKNLWRKERIKL
ncbi:replication initiator protein [Capybara microvirus Cap1_SP_77]|nr:replication initiator protein [Capybara microvirus Cap1_SP_77]